MKSRKALIIQCCVRQWLARRRVCCLRRERRRLEAINLEKRQLQLEEITFQQAVRSTVVIQCAWRQHVARQALKVQKKRFATGELQKQWQQYAIFREAIRMKLQQLERAWGGMRMQTIYAEEKSWEQFLVHYEVEIAELNDREQLEKIAERAFEIFAEELRLIFSNESARATDGIVRDEFLQRHRLDEQAGREWMFLQSTLLIQLEWAWKAEYDDIVEKLVSLSKHEQTSRHVLIIEELKRRKHLVDDCISMSFELLQAESDTGWDDIVAQESVAFKQFRTAFRMGRRKAKEASVERDRFWDGFGDLLEQEGAQREFIILEELYARRNINADFDVFQRKMKFALQRSILQHQEFTDRKQLMDQQINMRLELIANVNAESRRIMTSFQLKHFDQVMEQIFHTETVRRTEILKTENTRWIQLLNQLWLDKIQNELEYVEIDEDTIRQEILNDEVTEWDELDVTLMDGTVNMAPKTLYYRESCARSDIEHEQLRCWQILMATYDQLHGVITEMQNLRDLEARDHVHMIQTRIGYSSPTYLSPMFAPMSPLMAMSDDGFTLDNENDEITEKEFTEKENEARSLLMEKEEGKFRALVADGIAALEQEHRNEIETNENESHWTVMYEENIDIIGLSTQAMLLKARLTLSREALTIHEEKGTQLMERIFKRQDLYRKVRSKLLVDLAKATKAAEAAAASAAAAAAAAAQRLPSARHSIPSSSRQPAPVSSRQSIPVSARQPDQPSLPSSRTERQPSIQTAAQPTQILPIVPLPISPSSSSVVEDTGDPPPLTSTRLRAKLPPASSARINSATTEGKDDVLPEVIPLPPLPPPPPPPQARKASTAAEDLDATFRTLMAAMVEVTQHKSEYDQKMEELSLRAEQLSSRTPRVTFTRLEREAPIAPLKQEPNSLASGPLADIPLDEFAFDPSTIPSHNTLARAYLDSADDNLQVSDDHLASLASIHAVIHGDSTTTFLPDQAETPTSALFSPSPPSKKRPIILGASGVPIRKFPLFSLKPSPRPTSVDSDPNYCPEGHGMSPTFQRTNDGDHAISYPSHYSRNLSPMATREVHCNERLVGTDALSRILFEQSKDGGSRPSSVGSPSRTASSLKMYGRMERAVSKPEVVEMPMSVASAMMPTLRQRNRNRSPRTILKMERVRRSSADLEAAAKIDRKTPSKQLEFIPLAKEMETQMTYRTHLRSTVTNTTAHCDHHLSQRGNLKVCCMKCLVNTYSVTQSPTA